MTCPSTSGSVCPPPPGRHVDLERCVCGASYDDSVYDVCWLDGVALVRASNGPSGGFRSRGPVLWAMRVIKAHLWYAEHDACVEVPF